MDSLVNFVVHHTELANLSMIVVILTNSIVLTVYKKRHNNELPLRLAKLVAVFVLGNAIAFGGFCIDVLASHK